MNLKRLIISVGVISLIAAMYIFVRYFKEINFYIQAWFDGIWPPILTIYVLTVSTLAILICPYLIYKAYYDRANNFLMITLGILVGLAVWASDFAIMTVFRKMEAIV